MYKTFQGIVLKRTPFSDNSAYITALTEKGLEKFSAKGILSPKNKNAAAAKLFSLSEFIVSSKGESETLSSASLLKPLIRQGVDFEDLSLANYVATLAHDTAFSEEDSPAIYKLLGTSLLEINKKQVKRNIIKAVFELRLSALLGFFPELDSCSRCKKDFDGGIFLPLEGVLLCEKCAVFSEKTGITISKSLKDGIISMLSLSDKNAFGIRFSNEKAENAFSNLAEDFSLNHLDCATSALNFYKKSLKDLDEFK